jgi:carbamoyl-phosphate synthase small subunit
MNAVICTDGTSVDDLKLALSKVPDMKGLNWLLKFL